MNYFNTWGEAFFASMQGLWFKFADFIPQFSGALIVLIVGLIVASTMTRLINRLLKLTKLDNMIEKSGLVEKFDKAGIKFSFAGLLTWIVKWFFIIVVLIAVVDILNWHQVTQFLQDIALYIPNVAVAVLILAVGVVVGQFVHQVVGKAVAASRLTSSVRGTLAAVAKWAIIIFSLMAALVQLQVAADLIRILFTGLVAMLAIAGGLAFGLGGREKARDWLDKITK